VRGGVKEQPSDLWVKKREQGGVTGRETIKGKIPKEVDVLSLNYKHRKRAGLKGRTLYQWFRCQSLVGVLSRRSLRHYLSEKKTKRGGVGSRRRRGVCVGVCGSCLGGGRVVWGEWCPGGGGGHREKKQQNGWRGLEAWCEREGGEHRMKQENLTLNKSGRAQKITQDWLTQGKPPGKERAKETGGRRNPVVARERIKARTRGSRTENERKAPAWERGIVPNRHARREKARGGPILGTTIQKSKEGGNRLV